MITLRDSKEYVKVLQSIRHELKNLLKKKNKEQVLLEEI
jgi:hypothetical protein